jgi:hypothetical protein
VPAIFERRRGRLSSKISGCGQLAEWRFTSPCPVYSRKQTPNGKDRRVRFGSWPCQNASLGRSESRVVGDLRGVFCSDYALIAAISGCGPMMLITRVRL